MGSDWREVRFEDVVELQAGFAFKSKDFLNEGKLRLARGANISQGSFNWSDTKYLPSDHRDIDDRYQLASGDVLLAMDRPWIPAGLKYAVVRPSDLPALLVQRVARLRARGDRLDQRFLYYLLGSPAFTDYVRSVETGTTIPHISGKQIMGYRVCIPPIEEQRAIAEVLGALDDRIEWCAGAVGRLEALLLELVRGEAAAVPVAELATYVNGGAYTKHAAGSGRLVIRIAELSSGVGSSSSSKYADIDAPPERTAYPGDILFSWSATLDVYRWTADEAVVNQHIFKVLPAEQWQAWVVYAKLKEAMPTFQKIAHDRATTMGHIKRGHLKQVSVGLPDEAHLEQVRDLGDALWDQHLRASREQLHLANLRDTVLPRLLSGEVRIRDPERVLGAVA